MKFPEPILHALKSAKDFIIEQMNRAATRHEQKQAAISQQRFYIFCNQLAEQMQMELFEVFKLAPYRFLSSITIPPEIMFVKWRIQQGQTIFTFQINTDPMPSLSVLKQCLSDMKMLTYRHQQELIASMGFEQAQLLYPCITNGLYIVNIRQVGCMVQFDVITNVRF